MVQKVLARATEILGSFIIWILLRFRSWLVSFGSSLDPFVSGLIPINVLSSFNIQDGCRWFMNFNWDFWLMRSVDWKKILSSILKNSEIKNSCWSLWCSCIDFKFGNALLEFGSGFAWFLLKIRSVRILDTIACSEHCFGCSLRPGTPLNSPWKMASSVLSWLLTLPI